MIYLDNAATTKPYKSVVEIADMCMNECWGNPGSSHTIGKIAHKEIIDARNSVSEFINSKSDNIIFTSSGSEANNYVIRNEAERANRINSCIAISAGEHESIYNAATSLSESEGIDCHIIPLNKDGTVNMEMLDKIITEKHPSFVSVIHTSNELGSINPVKTISEICHRNGARFHTDCVQAAGFSAINVKDIGCEYLTFSSHKIHGIKGAAALYVQNPSFIIDKLIIGGENQEFGYRGGTENVASIAAFGEACRITQKNMRSDIKKVQYLKQLLYEELIINKALNDMNINPRINGTGIVETGKTINITLPGIDAKTLIMVLEQMGVFLSGGSACKSQSQKPSRILIASGMSEEEARSSFRITFDGSEENGNTPEDIRYVVSSINQAVDVLKNMNN